MAFNIQVHWKFILKVEQNDELCFFLHGLPFENSNDDVV